VPQTACATMATATRAGDAQLKEDAQHFARACLSNPSARPREFNLANN
jgi:hypothetical protein